MTDFRELIFFAILGGVLSFALSGFGEYLERKHWEAETVSRGLAIYCPTSGDWAWKGECDK
jgi:hypothetical protein